jgi:hypothetical protein
MSTMLTPANTDAMTCRVVNAATIVTAAGSSDRIPGSRPSGIARV